MNEKIYFTRDDKEILDYVIDAGIKLDDDLNLISTFILNDNYHLILYFSFKGDKGLVMFRIDNIKENLNEISNLKKHLKELLNKGGADYITEKAIYQLEIIETAGMAAEIFKTGKLPDKK